MTRFGRILAVLCFFISGCQNSFIESPTTGTNGVTAIAPNNRTPTPEVTVSTVPSPSNRPTPLATSETIATPTSQDYLVCENYKSIDLDDIPDLIGIIDLQFVDDDHLSVSVVLDRLDLSTPNIWEYSNGLLDLEAGGFSLEEQEPSPLLLNPCPQECQYDVLDQSPDGKWQIVRIFEENEAYNGIWLIGLEEKVQLVNYNPSNIGWEWTNDSSLLMFDYSLPEFGVPNFYIQLTSPPVKLEREPSESDPLEITYYDVAISPENWMILSTARNRRNVPNRESDELLVFDFRLNMMEPISSITISGLDGVEWNEATNSFLLFLDLDRRTEIREWQGSGVWSINDSNMPDRDLDGQSITVSPSGQRIAAYFRNQISVFSC